MTAETTRESALAAPGLPRVELGAGRRGGSFYSSSPSSHRSRFRRSKSSWTSPLNLSPIDLAILTAVHDYRLLSTGHFFLLFPQLSKDALYRGLRRLYDHAYLHRLPDSNLNAPLRYVLGEKGALALGVSYNPSRRLPSLQLAHRDLTTNVRIAFSRAASAKGWELAWELPLDLPMRPDGFLRLRLPDQLEGRNRTYAFVECDCSTEKRERYGAKLTAYLTWHDAGGHTEAFGIRGFRVLTITKTENRMRSLLGVSPPDPLFWFTSEGRIDPGSGSILGPIWELPGGLGSGLPLLPK